MIRPFACLFLTTTAAFAQTWFHNPQTGHDYALLPPMTWRAAEFMARQTFQAHLVAIESQQENAWVMNTFLTNSDLHIGMTDQTEEGVWRTVNGLSAPYTNWSSDPIQQPDNSGGTQHFAVMTTGATRPLWPNVHGQWDDLDGTDVLPAVMERPPAHLLPFGFGCAGSNGVPTLTPASNSLMPRPGNPINLQLSNLPTDGGLTFMIVSFSNAQWGPNQLPYNLATFGMPGCSAYVALGTPGWVEATPHENGLANWQQTIPNLGIVIGWKFYVQAWQPDAGVNQLGATVTNAVEGSIGV